MEYERLTERRGNLVIDKCGNCENVRNPQGCTEHRCYEVMKNRLAELEDKIERGELVENKVVTYINMARSDSKTLIDKAIKYDKLKNKIENGTLKEVVRCKDCVYFQPEFVEMGNKERRPYTEEEIKNGKIVSMEQGINCGSRCERYRYWDNNSIPVWFNENDFCSYGKLKAEAEQKLKELENESNV